MVIINKNGDDFLRKKELLLTLKNYIEKNTELESRMQELLKANEEVVKKSEELLKRAENAEKAIAELELKLASVNVADEQAVDSEEETVEPEEVVERNTPVYREPLETEDGIIDVTELENIPVNREMQYASEAIGDIVVKCATLCNEFAKQGGPTCRELINLALGRTEVFKADCLTIASSNTSFSVKKECVDRIKADTEDYFESLRAQLD